VKLLLCGFGSIGRRHFANTRALRTDTTWTILEPARALWREEPGVRFIADLAELDEPCDVALVCSPTNLHGAQLRELAGRATAFFIEKPLAHDRASLAIIQEAFAGRNTPTMVGCNYRFETGLLKVKELLDRGEIGRIISARAEFGQWLPSWRPQSDYRTGYAARRETGGGIVLDRIHELDYVTWLLGTPMRVVSMFDKLSSLEIETEDVAEILVRFESGAIGSVHVDYLQREYVCELKVVGERGTIEWRYRPTTVRLLREAGGWQTVYEDAAPDVNAMYVAELQHFYDALAAGTPPMNGLAEASRTCDIALRALEAP
jgi:predicted dehydrogenase